MALRFCILGSGSSGNCALLQSDGARILVDAGFSARKLDDLLAAIGTELGQIDAIFLTHEHSDHSAGLAGLRKYPHLKVFANRATMRAVQAGLDHQPAWQAFETGAVFQFRDLEIRSFAVPHDAQEPVGFIFTAGREGDLLSPRRRVAWLTDLGHAPQHIHEHVRDCEVLAIESNHCAQMLKDDPRRPWALKQRISGRHGHLSNDEARTLLETVASPRWKHIFLTHLSRDCNSPDAVALALADIRARLGCEFSIVAAGGGTRVYEFD
jgi:phosphoribosyl 1,2-cyclic phosphodiesterase